MSDSQIKFPLSKFEFEKLPTGAQEEIFAAISCVDKHNFCLVNRDTKKFCVSNEGANEGEGYDFFNNAYLECSSEIDEKIHDIKMSLFSAVDHNEVELVNNLLKNSLVDVNLWRDGNMHVQIYVYAYIYPYTCIDRI